jgi:hypothetical protein
MLCPTSIRSFKKVASVMIVVVMVMGSAMLERWRDREVGRDGGSIVTASDSLLPR